MDRRHKALAIIYFVMIGAILSGCMAFRGFDLPRYRESRMKSFEQLDGIRFDTRVITPVPVTLVGFGPEHGKLRDSLVNELDRLFAEAGVLDAHDLSSDLQVDIKLYIYPDASGFLDQVFGYLAGITLLVVPFQEKAVTVMKVDVKKNGVLFKQYSYEHSVHTWFHLLFLLALPFYDADRMDQKVIDDLVFNFIRDFNRDLLLL